jgi:hypothetical protein
MCASIEDVVSGELIIFKHLDELFDYIRDLNKNEENDKKGPEGRR